MNLVYKGIAIAASIISINKCSSNVNKIVHVQADADSLAIQSIRNHSKELLAKHRQILSINKDKFIKN